LLAVKAISIVEKDKRKQLTQELRTLTLEPNAYTIGFRGAYFDEAHIYIALEYMDGGSLDDLRSQVPGGRLGELELAYVFEQVLRGLKHLQRQRILHRDIKPHNILFDRASARFVLSDFGIISDLKQRAEEADLAQAKTFVGTLLYMSPERIAGAAYSFAADIWSMALSLLSCRVGQFAIPHNSHWELVNSIQSGPAILNNYSSDEVSDTLRDFLSACLRTNPAERPTAAECLRHPFFSHFRTRGAAMPIPRPPGFPPPPVPSEREEERTSAASSEREERRARKALEVEQRNQKHMIEQVCKLMVHRGMTSRGAGGNSSAASSPPPPGAGVPDSSPRRPACVPLDPRLCERICERVSTLLKVPAEAVRAVLLQTHNQYVGLTPPASSSPPA